MAKEGECCSLTTTRPNVPPPIRFPFKKELGQKYVQPSGLGINLSEFTLEELSKEGPGGVYPLVIR
jgi:E3 ubiquitin-protein ligase MGRN1